MNDKKSRMESYIKGSYSVTRNPMNYWESAGYDDRKRAMEEPSGTGGSDLMEMIIESGKGKRWTKWSAAAFALAAAIYCFFSVESIILSIFIVIIAAVCGYGIIGLSVILGALLFAGFLVYLFAQFFGWLIG